MSEQNLPNDEKQPLSFGWLSFFILSGFVGLALMLISMRNTPIDNAGWYFLLLAFVAFVVLFILVQALRQL